MERENELVMITISGKDGPKFLDSYKYLLCPLRNIPTAFNFETQVKKGKFPHDYNTPANQSVVGKWPDISYYGSAFMTTKELQEMQEFLAEKSNEVFDFKKEIFEYCRADTDILRLGILKFRDLIRELTTSAKFPSGLEAFEKNCTLAGLSQLIYRALFLKPQTIPIIPIQGYSVRDVQSEKALMYFTYLEQKFGIKFQHAGNLGERRIFLPSLQRYVKVDGYCEIIPSLDNPFLKNVLPPLVDNENKLVIEVLGDYFHGCPLHTTGNRINPHAKITFEALHSQTLARERAIREAGYWYSGIWECQIDDLLANNSDFKLFSTTFRKNRNYRTPLVPRDCIQGGRTESFYLYYATAEDEKIRFLDTVSLYPYVMCTKEFPIGTVSADVLRLRNNHEALQAHFFGENGGEKTFGICKVTMIPPRKLLIPLIGMKSSGKLVFSLCRTCSDLGTAPPSTPGGVGVPGDCRHSDDERSFTGVYSSFEIRKAIDLGYRVKTFHESYHFENRSTNLFSSFVKLLVKVKLESSGCKDNSDEGIAKFVKECRDKQGIELDPEKLKAGKNCALRTISKILLNASYGRLSLKSQSKKVEYIEKPEKLFKILDDPGYIIHDLQPVGEDNADQRLRVVFSDEDEYQLPIPTTNVILAGMICSYARLHLYSMLEKLQFRALYCDTDSVFFFEKNGEDLGIVEGSMLGNWNNEIEDPDDYITTFLSLGPKTYIYRTAKNRVVMKLKGVQQNHQTEKSVNFETMYKLIQQKFNGSSEDNISLQQQRFIRKQVPANVMVQNQSKELRFIFDKRVIANPVKLSTVPYGY